VRIHVVDPAGLGLGPAIGLCQLGHAVRYSGWVANRAATGDVARMVQDLVQHFFGAEVEATSGGDEDLLVIVDCFADRLRELESAAAVAAVAEGDPFGDAPGSSTYPRRLAAWRDRIAASGGRTVVVDLSDCAAPREIGFEAVPGAVLLQREAAAPVGPWQPFPFLYNTVVLWLEHRLPRKQWWVPSARRPRHHDWVFCGTVDHGRYGGRRRRLLADCRERWPHLRSCVRTDGAFADVVKLVQTARCGLDLPGVGDVCFRRHELLALGVPVWRPVEAPANLPRGLEAVVCAAPDDLLDLPAEFVAAVYAERYSPVAAARTLLTAAASAPVSCMAAEDRLG
jgi:hypothetical protein